MADCLRALCLAVLCLGCARAGSPPPALSDAVYPGTLRGSASLPEGLLLRQRVHARYGDRKLSFSAVVETAQGVLRLVVLDPFGRPALWVEQRGQEVRSGGQGDQPPPFPPRFMLLDLHRVYFVETQEDPAVTDGERRFTRDAEEIVERHVAGRLTERRFRRLDGKPPGEIVVRYVGGMAGGESPGHITLDNGWFGYQLDITTLR